MPRRAVQRFGERLERSDGSAFAPAEKDKRAPPVDLRGDDCWHADVATAEGNRGMVDEAVRRYPLIEAFLTQRKDERAELGSGYAQLATLLQAPIA